MKIPLRNSNKKAVIDDADLQKVNSYKWRYLLVNNKQEYAITDYYVIGKKTTITMHRLICDAEPGDWVRHYNMYGLDNRRSNLDVKRKNNIKTKDYNNLFEV